MVILELFDMILRVRSFFMIELRANQIPFPHLLSATAVVARKETRSKIFMILFAIELQNLTCNWLVFCQFLTAADLCRSRALYVLFSLSA